MTVLLLVTRRKADGAYVFRIDVDGTVRMMTSDPRHAAATLTKMGVSRADDVVRQARERGSVEIATDSPDEWSA